jgi:predicted nuclease of predicted toxin-antitoxin system
MAILSLPCGYELKDISGIFQPRFISFGAERKIVWLRMKNRSPENEKSFG